MRSRNVARKVEAFSLVWETYESMEIVPCRCRCAPHILGSHPDGWTISSGKLDEFSALTRQVWRPSLPQSVSEQPESESSQKVLKQI